MSLPARAASPLEDSSKINFAADNDPATSDAYALCTATAQAQTAPAGRVCMYFVNSSGVEDLRGFNLNHLRDQGFMVLWNADGTGDMYVEFSWAYTAP